MLGRDELSLLPKECRPGRITSPAEISAIALTCVQENLKIQPSGATAWLLRDLIDFFTAAAQKMAELQAAKAK